MRSRFKPPCGHAAPPSVILLPTQPTGESLLASLSRPHPHSVEQTRFVQELKLRGYILKPSGPIWDMCGAFSTISCPIRIAPFQVYSLHLLEKGQSHFYVNQAISALKFYMKLTGDENVGSYVRPKKETKLPNVLSTEKSPSCSAP